VCRRDRVGPGRSSCDVAEVLDLTVEAAIDVLADRVPDLGPGAGDAGGRIVAAGTPEQVATAAGSRTARFLAARLPKADGERSGR